MGLTPNANLQRPQYGLTVDENADANLQALDALLPGVEVDNANGAIALKNGVVMITKGSAAAMTLAAPVAGTDDRKRLTIISTGAFAHTVTTPTNGINGSKHIATFAAVGDRLELIAYQGVWYAVNTNTTLS